MCITGIGHAVLKLLSFKTGSGNHQMGSPDFRNFGHLRLVPLKMTSQLTSHNFQILIIKVCSKLCHI